MGADGGYLPVRCDLMKLKPKEKKIDPQVKARNRARLCMLSKERLKKPIVICRLGNFYNYEAILTHLMNKTLPEDFQHIKKIKKDLREVNLTQNTDTKSDLPFMCPLSKIEFNGINKFVSLWGCGCVFSKQLIENVKSEKKVCPICQNEYGINDIINLTLSDEEQNDLFNKIIQEEKKKDKIKQKKKQEKNKDGDNVEKIEKKVKKEEKKDEKILGQPTISLIQKLAQDEVKKQKENKIYASLIHSKTPDEDYEHIMFRNTRHGFR